MRILETPESNENWRRERGGSLNSLSTLLFAGNHANQDPLGPAGSKLAETTLDPQNLVSSAKASSPSSTLSFVSIQPLDLLSFPVFFQKATIDEKQRLSASTIACRGWHTPNLPTNEMGWGAGSFQKNAPTASPSSPQDLVLHRVSARQAVKHSRHSAILILERSFHLFFARSFFRKSRPTLKTASRNFSNFVEGMWGCGYERFYGAGPFCPVSALRAFFWKL